MSVLVSRESLSLFTCFFLFTICTFSFIIFHSFHFISLFSFLPQFARLLFIIFLSFFCSVSSSSQFAHCLFRIFSLFFSLTWFPLTTLCSFPFFPNLSFPLLFVHLCFPSHHNLLIQIFSIFLPSLSFSVQKNKWWMLFAIAPLLRKAFWYTFLPLFWIFTFFLFFSFSVTFRKFDISQFFFLLVIWLLSFLFQLYFSFFSFFLLLFSSRIRFRNLEVVHIYLFLVITCLTFSLISIFPLSSLFFSSYNSCLQNSYWCRCVIRIAWLYLSYSYFSLSLYFKYKIQLRKEVLGFCLSWFIYYFFLLFISSINYVPQSLHIRRSDST